MDQLALRVIELVSQHEGLVGYSVLFLSALIEYVFPPFPGDTVTLFGAFLITAQGWSLLGVFGSVLGGSAAGAYLAFRFGRWVKRRQLEGEHKHPRTQAAVNRLVERFQRHGEAYIVLNRFLPGLRALFFVAAGMAGMRTVWVMVWAIASATLWNLLIVAVGTSVGANFEELLAFLRTYSRLVWTGLGLLGGAWIVRVAYRRFGRRKA